MAGGDLQQLCQTFHFDHISETLWVFNRAKFHVGAPLPVPLTWRELLIGQDRLKRLYDTCQRPVGVENLAFSFTIDDVKNKVNF